MRDIARDEARHAKLAAAIAQWADARLSSADRASVRKARDAAVQRMLEGLCRPVGSELVSALGMPTASQARALAEDLSKRLWL